ncbi:protein IQ-DOMAIN 10-like [Impatiens glandulifera]|uniref:protein IQ-DOMAIN 10-like n=1 Tax=Impatiens glandulifera TaxID=253017 RepID=UPI001FB0B39E|nr:protein IQ-DOMAIN 10-like [Impatiens glandulifera]
MGVEDIAALRIQTAYRSFRARKALGRMKGAVKLQALIEDNSVRRQITSALNHIHVWSRIQAEIKDRRICMVVDERMRQRRNENKLKLEAKLQDVEVEWCGGAETMEEIVAKIYHREEAAIKRERSMAYAFSHQWRPDNARWFSQAYFDLSKENWGWSWKERWVTLRPWEMRIRTRKVAKTPNGGIGNKNKKKIMAKIINGGKETTESSIIVKPSSSSCS